ncbi:MAG: D-glycero-beta-D-manno-heptose 1-phosphate adenylyltransferase [Bacteroidia bacterium]
MNKQAIESKIFSTAESFTHQLAIWKFQQKKIVFTNGCFDLLHAGHIDYLSKAADEGDVLIVGLNTDRSVTEIKGPKRPINNGQSRALLLASLSFVNAVVLFEEATPYNLIKTVEPDVLIKGADYKPDEIAGSDLVKSKNGLVKTIPLLEGYSTSAIEQRIVENHTKG